MIKFTDWVLDKILTLKGVILSGADNGVPLTIQDSVFEDRSFPLIGKRLSSNIGKVDNNYDELAVKFQSGGNRNNLNDIVGVNIELTHSSKKDGKIYPHLHLWQEQSAVDRVFTLLYRIQNNGANKATVWQEMTASVLNDNRLPYTNGTINQVISFKNGNGSNYIDMTGIGLSATLQFKIVREDNNSGDILATFFDFHYEIGTLGSRQEMIR